MVVKYSDTDSGSGSEKEERIYRNDFATDYHAKRINGKIEKIELLIRKENVDRNYAESMMTNVVHKKFWDEYKEKDK